MLHVDSADLSPQIPFVLYKYQELNRFQKRYSEGRLYNVSKYNIAIKNECLVIFVDYGGIKCSNYLEHFYLVQCFNYKLYQHLFITLQNMQTRFMLFIYGTAFIHEL